MTMIKLKTFARSTGATALAAVMVIAATDSTRAAEVRVLSAAAMQTVLNEIAADFERGSGHKLNFTYTTMGAITHRVLAGETADVIIGSTASMERLAKEGKIDPDSRMRLARVGIGVVVPAGTPKPPIGSAEELKRALLAAKTVVYADPAGGGAAGIHIARLIETLGLADELRAKTKFGAGGDVTEVTLAEGSGALGLTQISEIVGKTGADFVGPLPGELQNYTGVTAGTPSGHLPSRPVASFLRYLQGPKAVAVIKAKGMEVD